MIHVNLLPEELRPVKRTPIPYILSAVVLIVAILGVYMVYANTQSQIESVNAEYLNAKAEFDKLSQVVEDYNTMIELKRTLSTKIATINEIVQDRIIWSKQLYNVSRLLPDNMWVGEIEVTTKKDTETRMVRDPKTKELKPERVPVTRRVMNLSGYVVEGEEGSNVTPLINAVETDEEFSEMFELISPSLVDTTFSDFPVKEFTLEFEIRGEAGDVDS